MITKQLVRDYDLQDKRQFYHYILESFINGQIQQATELLNKCSHKQKKSIYFILNEYYPRNDTLFMFYWDNL